MMGTTYELGRSLGNHVDYSACEFGPSICDFNVMKQLKFSPSNYGILIQYSSIFLFQSTFMESLLNAKCLAVCERHRLASKLCSSAGD